MAAHDWTTGVRRLLYLRCAACAGVWYFRRSFCPTCGSRAVETREAVGAGKIHAVTTVARAPTPAWQTLAPYTVVLVDAAEGFRVMAHGEPGLSIDDPVTLEWRTVGDAVVPFFSRA